MTKKNKAFIPTATPTDSNKQRWEELEDIHNSILNGIFTITSNLQNTLNIVKDIDESNNPILVSAVKTITNDIAEVTDAVINLKKRYEGKKGYVEDGDDLALCLDIFNDYVLINEKFKSVTLEPMLTITEEVSNIAKVYNDKQESSDD